MKKLFGILKKLILLPWRLLTWIREILANLILLVIIIIVVVAFWGDEQTIAVPEKGALIIAPSGDIVEQRTYVDPMALLMSTDDQHATETLLSDIVMSIDHASTDKNITALVLDTGWMQDADVSKILSIGEAINRFKKSGKPVFAVGDSFTQGQYFLASYADKIYVNPMGAVMLHGFGAYPNFFKDALDKLKVNVHVFRVGDYKSFVEPFIRNSMSDESKENTALWLNDLWQQTTVQIEKNRKLEANSINTYINTVDHKMAEVRGDAAKLALEAHLIDGIATRDEMKNIIAKTVGENAAGDSFAAVDMESYAQRFHHAFSSPGKKIGVIVAKGEILDGEQPAGVIGGDSLAEQIQLAREDDSIKAVVLRVDSPGGSAFASEIIRRELELTQKAGKPVVASFGGVAASGGYWIASTADEIWATPGTITGSIGVFGMIPTFEHSLEALGVYSDGVGTTELAGAMHLDRPMSPILERSVQLEVEHIYQNFLELVAAGRKSSPEKIHLLAQGQVWSGAKAKELGLVDQLGDLDAAIAAAAKRANLGERYHWEFLEKSLSPKEELIQKLTSETAQIFDDKTHAASRTVNPVDKLLSVLKQQLKELTHYNDPRGVYVRCLECRIN